MATRNIYLKLSRAFQGKRVLLKLLLFTVWLGGFLLILLLSAVIGSAELIVNTGGKIWFSTCALLGVTFMAVDAFNPERDPIDKSPNESWLVIVLNCIVIMAIYVWFIGD